MHSLTSAPFSYRAGNSFVMVEYISPGMRRMSDCTTRAQYSASSCKVDSREIPFRKRKQGGKRLEGSERYVSGINIQILDAKLNQEEGPCSGSFTRNINSHGRGVFAFRNGHLILPSVFTGLFMIMRTNCPRDQTRLYKGRPRSVFRFPIVRLTRPSQFGTTITSSYLFLSLSRRSLSPSTFNLPNPPTGKSTKLKAKVLSYLKRVQKMPVLMRRSVSATSSNRPYLTPQTPLSTHPRALVDMTPLPSLFDKMIDVAKRSKRSTSLQLKSMVDDDPFALPSVPEEPSSDPLKVHCVRQPSDTPIEVGDEPEDEPVAHQPSTASDYMDFEDTLVVFSEPVYPSPPPVPIVSPLAPAPIFPLVHEEIITNFPPSNPFGTYLVEP